MMIDATAAIGRSETLDGAGEADNSSWLRANQAVAFIAFARSR